MHGLLNSTIELLSSSESVVWYLAELMGKSIVLLGAFCLIEKLTLERKPLLSDRLWRLVPALLLILPFVVFLSPSLELITISHFNVKSKDNESIARDMKHKETSGTSVFQSENTEPSLFSETNRKAVTLWQQVESTTSKHLQPEASSKLVVVILCIYWLVTAFLLLRLLRAYVDLRRVHMLTESVNVSVWNLSLISQKKRIGCNAIIDFRHSDCVKVPMAYGFVHPTIVVPSKLLSTTDPNTVDAILLHELTHIARSDYLMQILFKIIQAFYWCNPFVWLAVKREADLREVICDGYTASVLKSRQEYINVLLEQARELVGTIDNELSLAMSGKINLEKRLHSLKHITFNSFYEKRNVSLCLAAFAVALTSILGTMGVAESDSLNGKTRGTLEESSPSDSLDKYMGERQTERLLDRQDDYTNEENSVIRCWMSENGKKDWSVVVDRDSGIKGYVFDSQDRPLIGVEVMAVRKIMHAKLREPVEVYVKTKTDATGFYKLFLEPDRYELRARVDRIGSFLKKGKNVQKNSFDEINMHLKPTATFRAKFIDSVTLLPVAGMRLKSWEPKGLQGISGSNGEMVIRNVFAKNVQFSVTGKNGSNKGRGVAGEYGRWWSKEASFEYQKLTKQPARFQRNFDRLNFNVTKSMKPVTIFLEPCVTVRGRVFDPHGDPVPGATVSPARTGTGNSLTGDGRYMFRTNAEGAFELRMPASHEASYNLVAHDGKYNKWRSWANGVGETIQTKPGDVLDNVELHLTFPGSVSGQVVDSQGEIQAGVEVKAIPQDMKQNRYLFPQATSDSKGQYHFKFLRPGKYWFVASRYTADIRLYDPSDVQEVEVQGNKTRRNVTLKKTDRLKKVN